MSTAISGVCCNCGYSGEEETLCTGNPEEGHCDHWWDGPSIKCSLCGHAGHLGEGSCNTFIVTGQDAAGGVEGINCPCKGEHEPGRPYAGT